MDQAISSFSGEYSFLSNFHPCTVVYEDDAYPSSEHAYQAAKTIILAEREAIRLAVKPGKAKMLGKKVTLRKDWGFLRTVSMREILETKFQDPEMRSLLAATGKRLLVEGNHWNDTFWGVCRGKGENRLGKMLMDIRAKISA
jgi:ribA/ribD-fused uncharacterized protein